MTLFELELRDKRALALVDVILDSGVVVKFALKIVDRPGGLGVEWTKMGNLLRWNQCDGREDVPAEMADAAIRAYLDDVDPPGPEASSGAA